MQKHLLFIILLVIEATSQTFLAQYGNKDLSAVSYLVAGLALPICVLVQAYGNTPAKTSPQAQNEKLISQPWRLVALLLLSVALVWQGQEIITSRPLDYTFADMLPIIQIMGERWIAGQEVYAVIPEIWDGMQPIYLPLLWMSYVPALLADVDIRWVNIGALILVCALVLDVFSRRAWPALRLLVLLPLVILLSYTFFVYSTYISISEEPVVLLAYMLLAYTLWKKHWWGIAVALVACLLSRYALLFWAICWWAYEWWQGDQKKAWGLAALSASLGVIILWWSQGIYQLDLFYGLKDAYLDSFTPEMAWRTKNAVSKNIGLARFVPFGFLPIMHQLLFWGSILLPLTLYGLYYFRLRQRISPSLFAVCSLKLCLVFFYNVNPLPYSYLFYTSTFFSLFIFLMATEMIQRRKSSLT